MDLTGIEPVTSSMPWKRAPSCATGPLLGKTVLYSQTFGLLSQTLIESQRVLLRLKCFAIKSALMVFRSRLADLWTRSTVGLGGFPFINLFVGERELMFWSPVSKHNRVSEHSAAGGAVLSLL